MEMENVFRRLETKLLIPGMPETTIHPQVSLLMSIVPLIVECFDIQLVKAKEISKTFRDRRGSVKWIEMQEIYKLYI